MYLVCTIQVVTWVLEPDYE